MELHELKAEISASAADRADELLQEHEFANWRVIEDVVAQRAWVAGLGEREDEIQAQWNVLAVWLAEAGIELPHGPVSRALDDADWRESYKAHFHAWKFGRLHWVPVWEKEKFVLPPGDAVLWLDPGLAFGTGNHETTRLCVERLVTIAEEQGTTGRVIDAGCGSGILALSAALLGYRGVRGFDNDPEAVRISRENAVQNGLQDTVTFAIGDLTTGLAGAQAEVLLANIQADVLMQYAAELVQAVAPGGTLVLSGILAAENSVVRAAFEPLTEKWTLNARIMGEWSDVVLTRPRT